MHVKNNFVMLYTRFQSLLRERRRARRDIEIVCAWPHAARIVLSSVSLTI